MPTTENDQKHAQDLAPKILSSTMARRLRAHDKKAAQLSKTPAQAHLKFVVSED